MPRLVGRSSEASASSADPVEDKESTEDEFESEWRSEACEEFAEIDELLARTSCATESIAFPPRKRDESGLVYDDDWDEEGRLAEWRERLGQTTNLPPLMAAGVALDAWEDIEPLQRNAWLGPLLAGALLRRNGKTRHHLSALHAGFRHAKYRRICRSDFESRLMAFAHAIEVMAKADSKELDRLALARELLLRKCKDRRTNSRLPQLVDLCLASPVVTVPFVARELRASQQAATTMIDELSSNLRELTGRRRYRTWAII